MSATLKFRMTYAEYLHAEGASAVKHEFLRGEVWDMAGGTPEHGRLCANLIHELRVALASRPCVVFTSDVRVRVEATDRSTYPDVSVVCGPTENASDDPDAITNPLLLVEVLSDSTEADDRGEKFAHYRHLPALREYVLVSQKARRIEVYRRAAPEDGGGTAWVLTEAGPGERARLRSIEAELSVDAVYFDPRR